MPRLPSDKTVTHRIELGIPARAKLDEIIKTQKENQRIDGVTQTLQAVGTGLAGGGVIFAAVALAAWLAPGIVQGTYNKFKDAANGYFNEIGRAVAEPIVQERKDDLQKAYEDLTTAKKYKNLVCTPNSIGYDSAACIIATNNVDALQKVVAQKRQDITNFDTYEDDIYGQLEKLPYGKITSTILKIIY